MIDSLNYSLLSSDQLKTFGHRLVKIFEPIANEPEEHIFTPFVTRHSSAYDTFCKAFERESKNPYTELLAQKDALRGTSFLGFRNYIVACSHRPAKGWNEAGTRVADIIRKHGWSAPSRGYQTGTAAITSMIAEINNKCSAELALLAANEWLNELASAQDDFEQTFNASVSRPDSDGPTINETRPLLVNAIRSLLTLLDLQYSADSSNTKLADYMKAVNELISVTMSTARATETRTENKKKKSDTLQTDKQTETN